MQKTALITNASGQDSIYLTQLLLSKNYKIHLLSRQQHHVNASFINTGGTDTDVSSNINGTDSCSHKVTSKNLKTHLGDLTDSMRISELIYQIKPDEIYNLGAQSHVGASFEIPLYTANVNALGALRILEAVRNLNLIATTRIYQASSCELLDNIPQSHQLLDFYPKSPYAISKLFAYWMIVNYREAYGLYACNGILFNHESPFRNESFVTRKISLGLARIKLGLQDMMLLGNLSAKRDWGHAKDYVEMQWLMLQQDSPDDYIIATGQQHSVKEFIDEAAKVLNMSLTWEGEGINAQALDQNGVCRIKVDPNYFRPIDHEGQIADISKARQKLNWESKTTFSDLVEEMVLTDLKRAEKELKDQK